MTGTLFLVPVSLSENFNKEKSFPDYNIKIILKTNNFIVENARSARNFLSKCGKEKIQNLNILEIDKHNISFDDIKNFTKPLLQNEDIVILSESGCPCIADPGNLFVKFAHENNIKIVPLIGPSSILLSLMASGLNGQKFLFHGYLPIEKLDKANKIKQMIKGINEEDITAIFIETPYRNNNLFKYLIKILPNDISLCVATDITGKNEDIKTKKIRDWKNFKFELKKLPTIFLIGN